MVGVSTGRQRLTQIGFTLLECRLDFPSWVVTVGEFGRTRLVGVGDAGIEPQLSRMDAHPAGALREAQGWKRPLPGIRLGQARSEDCQLQSSATSRISAWSWPPLAYTVSPNWMIASFVAGFWVLAQFPTTPCTWETKLPGWVQSQSAVGSKS